VDTDPPARSIVSVHRIFHWLCPLQYIGVFLRRHDPICNRSSFLASTDHRGPEVLCHDGKGITTSNRRVVEVMSRAREVGLTPTNVEDPTSERSIAHCAATEVDPHLVSPAKR
jgi:hypothetical protein